MAKRFLFLCAVAFILYFPTLKAPFTFDDQPVILANISIQHLNQGFKGLQEIWDYKHTRFLNHLSYAINFYFHKFDVLGYHFLSLLIHILTAMGVLCFTKFIIDAKEDIQSKFDIPLLAALLFIVHPVNTESVSYIAQRASSLVALFYVWSVFFYAKARRSLLIKDKILGFSFAGMFAFLSIFSKETALTIPLAYLLVDYLILNKKPPRWLMLFLILLILIVGAFFDFKWLAVLFGGASSQSHYGEILSFSTYLMSQLKVLVLLLKLTFIPFPLNLDYDFPMSRSIFDLAEFLSLAFLSILIWLGYIYRKSNWYFSFAIFWFFISLLTHVLPLRANVIAEHKLYLTYILLMPVLCYGLYKALSPKSFFFLTIFFIIFFSALTIQRNLLWADPVLIWKDTISKSPHKARPYLNLAWSYAHKGDFSSALKVYLEALAIKPVETETYINIATIYQRQKMPERAFSYINKAIEKDPQFYLSYFKRGSLLASSGRYFEAIADFSKVLELNSDYWESYRMRGKVYFSVNEDRKSLNDMNIWLSKSPLDIEILTLRAEIYFRQKQYDKALEDYNKLMQLHPNEIFSKNRNVLYEILNKNNLNHQKIEQLDFKVLN